MEKGDFIGRAALEARYVRWLARTLVGLEMIEGADRSRWLLLLQREGAKTIGVVTSGSPRPTLGKNIALAYVPLQCRP